MDKVELNELLQQVAAGEVSPDEAGLLPPDLKRGVLSEDGVYDLLSEYDTLKKQYT